METAKLINQHEGISRALASSIASQQQSDERGMRENDSDSSNGEVGLILIENW